MSGITPAARVSGTIKAMAEAAAHLNQIAEYADMMASGHASYIGAIKRRAEATLGILAAIQPDPEPQPVAWRFRECPGFDWHVADGDPQRDPKLRGYEIQPLYATPSSAGTVSVEAAALEGAVNWLDALISLIEDTSCEPDDEERFEDVMMGARLWLKNGRAALRALGDATDLAPHTPREINEADTDRGQA